MTTRVSLAELAAAGIRLHPAEAVAIVTELCGRCDRGELRGLPTPSVIRVTREGDLIVEGPVTTGDNAARAAQLLGDLLPGFEAAPEYRASGALRLAMARAVGALDVPPYSSRAEFCAALQRFSDLDARQAAQTLFHAWERSSASQHLGRVAAAVPLTISDIRRARRATGMSLAEVSQVAEVPSRRLRNLEWGDLRDWHPDDEGRSQVVRYARAAGLDEGVVLSIAWPMIEQMSQQMSQTSRTEGRREKSVALVPSGPQGLTASAARAPRPGLAAYRPWIAAAVVVILMAIVFAVAVQVLGRVDVPAPPPRARVAAVGIREPAPAPLFLPVGVGVKGDIPDAARRDTRREAVRREVVRPKERVRPAVVRARNTHPPARRAPAPSHHRADRKTGLLAREWIRVVIR